jgi:hypothetical protein
MSKPITAGENSSELATIDMEISSANNTFNDWAKTRELVNENFPPFDFRFNRNNI